MASKKYFLYKFERDTCFLNTVMCRGQFSKILFLIDQCFMANLKFIRHGEQESTGIEIVVLK